ncbi:hypothetical protein PC129_g9374 [Phytophthora cactorum]|uniref:Uncharacterized protein n=1 Tax=Phytophthora cactorum TaxID=29920 RepID=A0A329S5A2_9STRA|nr:hypothetical protein Pcac1_g6202 [Phytophthora cactorum]KAG2821674.1 hypothetical protein PC111_g10940 [Phytophthora cactorum]KAG2824438.1 hypothetical protein PC112_g10106 [Phytophthora cactorum]KAG2857498.1 hypothetical protein PC113_g10632 [Phytophthora cactorum]KAG2892336.1 hypothetical protein PC114_g16665 [Phytophthora cactorum]
MTDPLKYTSERVSKNWNGKEWQQYKWAMERVFKKKKLTDMGGGKDYKTDAYFVGV